MLKISALLNRIWCGSESLSLDFGRSIHNVPYTGNLETIDRDIIMEAIAILNQYIKERSSIKRVINDSRDQWETYMDKTVPNLIPSPNVSCSESAVEVTSYKCRIL